LIALGAQLRQAPHVEASLAAEMHSAKAVYDRIKVLDAKIKKLECNSYWWARRPLCIIATLLTSGLARIGVGMITNVSNQWENKHFGALTAITRLKVIVIKRKILSLCIAGVILCYASYLQGC
jgi:hypothetical protein